MADCPIAVHPERKPDIGGSVKQGHTVEISPMDNARAVAGDDGGWWVRASGAAAERSSNQFLASVRATTRAGEGSGVRSRAAAGRWEMSMAMAHSGKGSNG